MKRLTILGLACVVAAAVSGCGSVSNKDRLGDPEAKAFFDSHQRQAEQTSRYLESRISKQNDGSGT